jgi:hypothetical protein
MRLERNEYLARYFRYHKPNEDQRRRMEAINTKATEFAASLWDNCPESAERTLALRAVEEARMRANQSIAVNESHRGVEEKGQ